MNTRFNIVTPCRRYNNLHILFNNLHKYTKDYNIEWYIIYDTYAEIFNPDFKDIDWIHQYSYRDPKSKGGHAQLNFALQIVKSGIFFPLDDDTVMHPDFFKVIDKQHKLGFFFHDELREGGIIYARPGHIKENEVGQQNFAIHTALLKNYQYPLDYTGDGKLIEKIYSEHPDNFVFIDQVLGFHNRLRRDDWQTFV